MRQGLLFSTGRPPNTAEFSSCGKHRYELRRHLSNASLETPGVKVLVSIGLNPSVASADKDDPTIRKESGFATRWGCDILIKGNANSYIATDPDDMKRALRDGVDVSGGQPNYLALLRMCALVRHDGILLVCWGQHIAEYRDRQAALAALIKQTGVQPMCLGTNQDGSPEHPLYIPYSRQLVPWECPS